MSKEAFEGAFKGPCAIGPHVAWPKFSLPRDPAGLPTPTCPHPRPRSTRLWIRSAACC